MSSTPTDEGDEAAKAETAGYILGMSGSTSARIMLKCGAPAPLAMNGSAFVSCNEPRGHAGEHHVTVFWGDQ